jgi:hypothetical protein
MQSLHGCCKNITSIDIKAILNRTSNGKSFPMTSGAGNQIETGRGGEREEGGDV